MKTCCDCREPKAKEAFWLKKSTKDGRNYRCAVCCRKLYAACAESRRASHKKYRDANKEKIATITKIRNATTRAKTLARNSYIKRTYGITFDQVESIIFRQGGGCAICKTQTRTTKNNFHIDHSHTTGKIRGVLCHNCNMLLGHAKESILILKETISYLASFAKDENDQAHISY